MKLRWYAIGLIIAIGCGTSVTEPKAQPEVARRTELSAPVKKTNNDFAQTIDAAEPTPIVADHDEPKMDSESTASIADVDSSKPETSEPDQPPPDAIVENRAPIEPGIREGSIRLLLPTSAAPLIVDVEIRINGVPLLQSFDQQIDKVLRNAAGESDDNSWRKLFEYVAANPMRFGNSSNVSRNQYRQIIQRYDGNRNGQPDRREAAKYLFQASPHSSAFRMFGTDAFRGSNRSQSPVFVALDRNRNEILENDEIETADRSLHALDLNADHRIDVNEVFGDVTDAADAWKRNRSKRWGQVAMDLSGHVDWSMLSYMVGNLDRPSPFGQSRTLISAIDMNDDGSVDADEAKQLLQVSPDLRLLVSYGSGGDGTIEIQELSHELQSRTTPNETPRQIGLVGASFSLVAQVKRSMTVANQFPDQAFAMFDVNNDGGLDETEIPEPALREYSFAEIDTNGDGKLTIQEIRKGFAAKEPIWFAQVRARGAESPDAVFAWLDQNQDRFLSEREINHANELLKSLASDDGDLKPANIPDTYLIQFGRGDPSQDAQLFSPAAPEANLDDPRPRWAVAMDTNRDGDISAIEFTGSQDRFESLDADRDGFLSAAETPVQ